MGKLVIVLCVAMLVTACVRSPIFDEFSGTVKAIDSTLASAGHGVGSIGGGAENHYMQPDDYFVSPTALTDETYIYVHLAKMATPPGPGTKSEAQFMKVVDGKMLWTNHYWTSTLAISPDLRLGRVVIAFNDRPDNNSVYTPPATKELARGGQWFMARITDVSDLYKGYVTVSGNYKVSLGNLRVVNP